jgi:glycosyltransferase involved in cell wall biosynthesis
VEKSRAARPRSLLTIGHSYCVALNRRLADTIAETSEGAWDVTVACPKAMQGDLRWIEAEPQNEGGARVVTVGAHWTNRIHFMAYATELKKLIQQKPWSLIHIWEEPYIYSGWQISRWARKIPHVFYTFQNLPKKYPWPFSYFERSSIARSAGWIAASQSVRENLSCRTGYEAKRHATIELGVDLRVFRRDPAARQRTLESLGWGESDAGAARVTMPSLKIESELDCPGRPLVIGYLGRFVKEKGLNEMMAALSDVKSPWRGLFVGGGEMEGDLRLWARKFGDQAKIVTNVAHDSVPAYLNAMDVLVAPSLTARHWREQLGRMILEAFACEVPIIGSDSGEIPNVIGECGLVVREGNIEQLRAAIETLLGSQEQRTVLAANGLVRVRDHFAWNRIAEKHLQFFDSMAGPCP